MPLHVHPCVQELGRSIMAPRAGNHWLPLSASAQLRAHGILVAPAASADDERAGQSQRRRPGFTNAPPPNPGGCMALVWPRSSDAGMGPAAVSRATPKAP